MPASQTGHFVLYQTVIPGSISDPFAALQHKR
jgi:hypothetical protein